MQVQLIENDLRLIYAAMRKGNFDDNVEILKKANLGKIITELKNLIIATVIAICLKKIISN